MKVTLVHGEHEAKARDRYSYIVRGVKKRGWSVIPITTERGVGEQLLTGGMFDKGQLYTLENLNKFGSQETEWLGGKTSGLAANLLVYHKGKLAAGLIKKLPKDSRVEEFKLPVILFKFLDSLTANNRERIYTLFGEVADRENLEFILVMMGRHFRDLYWANTKSSSLPYPQWRVDKLERSASQLSTGVLEKIINQMAEIDYKNKTSDYNLRLGIEMVILPLLI